MIHQDALALRCIKRRIFLLSESVKGPQTFNNRFYRLDLKDRGLIFHGHRHTLGADDRLGKGLRHQ